MKAGKCRWCSRTSGTLQRVALERDSSVLGARQRRMARIPVWEHAACLDHAEATRAAVDAERADLYRRAREAAAAGDIVTGLALTEQASDLTDWPAEWPEVAA